jgi:hypothetical protein
VALMILIILQQNTCRKDFPVSKRSSNRGIKTGTMEYMHAFIPGMLLSFLLRARLITYVYLYYCIIVLGTESYATY